MLVWFKMALVGQIVSLRVTQLKSWTADFCNLRNRKRNREGVLGVHYIFN